MKSIIGSVLLVCCTVAGSTQTTNKKPNIIYIYADDLGYGELGVYGQQKIKTPRLDQMAREGIRFTQHYTGAPVCAPARCMLLTGRHSGHSYIRGNYELGGFDDKNEGGQMPIPEGTFTIAQLMKNAGYTTGAIGKWGLGMYNNSGNPNKQGFDYFYGYYDQKQAHNYYPTHLWENGRWDTLKNPSIKVHQPLPLNESDPAAFASYIGKEYSLDKMIAKTIAFIKNNRNKPFFLYLPYTAPHVSLQTPASATSTYLGQFEESPYHGENGYSPTLYPRSAYAGLISYLDKQVGTIMQLLKELKLDNNTIVMFSSDNGTTFNVGGVDAVFFNSVGGLRGLKQDLYEGGIREPLIVRWPGRITAGSVSNHISAQYDLMATLCDIIGIQPPPTDGISFLPSLLGKTAIQQQHPYLYFEFPEKTGQLAIRIGHWKAVKSNMKNDKNAAWELYDLDTDTCEKNNIASLHPEIIKQLDSIVQKEHQPAHIKEWEFVDAKFDK